MWWLSYIRKSHTSTESTEYTEYQVFSPFVRIGYPAPSPASECCPPLIPKGGHTSLRERGRGETIWTKGQAPWYSWSSIIPLRKVLFLMFVEFPLIFGVLSHDTYLITYESFVNYSVTKIMVAVRGLVAISILCGLQNRVPGFTSSRPNWLPPPSPVSKCCLPLWFQGGGDTFACGWGGGGSQFGRRDRLPATL